jgi:hypothetical protein
MLLIGEGLKRELSDGELAISQFDQTIQQGAIVHAFERKQDGNGDNCFCS